MTINLRINEDLAKKLNEFSQRERRSKSMMIRLAVEKYLQELEEKYLRE